MPTPRKTPLPAVAGGQALKTAIHVARARAGLTSDVQLASQAGVHYDTLMNWYGDRTVPRPAEVKKVAAALGVPYADLMAAYEGVDPAPPPVQDALMALADMLRDAIEAERHTQAAILGMTDQLAELVVVMTITSGPASPPAMSGRVGRR